MKNKDYMLPFRIIFSVVMLFMMVLITIVLVQTNNLYIWGVATSFVAGMQFYQILLYFKERL